MNAEGYIRLQNVRGIGPKKLNTILVQLQKTGCSIDDLFNMPASEIVQKFSLPKNLAESVVNSPPNAQALSHGLRDKGIKVIVHGSEDYPKRLIETLGQDAPPILYIWGNLNLLSKPTVGFCGSRDVTEKGLDVTKDTAEQIAELGWIVVSGHARGVDTAAHRAALEKSSGTIIVAPEGLLNFKLHENLKKIARPDQILVVSQFPPTTHWNVGNAMSRNKTILGLSDAMILVEARLKGGTFEAGKAALAVGTPLYVADYEMPGESAAGNVYFLGKGATPLRKSRETSRASIGPLVDRVKQTHGVASRNLEVAPIKTETKQLALFETKLTSRITYGVEEPDWPVPFRPHIDPYRV